MTRRVVGALLAVMAALALGACGGSPPKKGNDVRVAIYSNPMSLSLIGNTDVSSSQLASMISDSLVAYDAQGRYVPMVARSWELSQDGTTLTFHLRDDVLWHDGVRVTSKDVAYTVAKAKDPATQAATYSPRLWPRTKSARTPNDSQSLASAYS